MESFTAIFLRVFKSVRHCEQSEAISVRVCRLPRLLQSLAMTVVLLFFLLTYLLFHPVVAHAASVTWTGGASGTWNTAGNWSNSAIPTAGDDVTIDNASVSATTTNINFNSLIVGSGTNQSALSLGSNIGTGGPITINNNGILIQANKVQQTISGTLIINSGGILTHSFNTTTNAFNVNFSAPTITVNSGGKINGDTRGYIRNSGPGLGMGNQSSSLGVGGGGHGGVGGAALFVSGNGGDGGISYDSTTNPTDLG